MIDRVLDLGPEHAIALKNISMGEAYFAGHFPDAPVMPAVFIVEALAQTSAFIGATLDQEDTVPSKFRPLGAKVFLTSIDLRFRSPAVPGDQLRLEVRLLKRVLHLMKVEARATVDQVEIATGQLTLAVPGDGTSS